MANVLIFKNSFVARIQSEVPSNLKRYSKDDSWTSEIGSRSDRELDSGVEFSGKFQLLKPEGQDLKDLENAIRLHKALPNLTLLQARDPRLWVRLTHVELWDYMRKRWPIERYLVDGVDKSVGRIKERYFVPQSQSRALMRNGAARLWWAAKLSYDKDRDNPYELTGVLMSTLDITQQLLERSFGRGPIVFRSFLDFLLRNKEKLLTGGNQNRARIRELAKFLNLRGGFCVLDYLSRSQMNSLLEEGQQHILDAERRSVEAVA